MHNFALESKTTVFLMAPGGTLAFFPTRNYCFARAKVEVHLIVSFCAGMIDNDQEMKFLPGGRREKRLARPKNNNYN